MPIRVVQDLSYDTVSKRLHCPDHAQKTLPIPEGPIFRVVCWEPLEPLNKIPLNCPKEARWPSKEAMIRELES